MAVTLSLTSTFRQSEIQNKDLPRRYLKLANLFIQVEKVEKKLYVD